MTWLMILIIQSAHRGLSIPAIGTYRKFITSKLLPERKTENYELNLIMIQSLWFVSNEETE